MNVDPETAQNLGELAPLPALLTAYAPSRTRGWHRLCWLLDQRLGAVVQRGGDPTIAAIRLAWWDEVLVAGDVSKGKGEPLVEIWRVNAPEDAARKVERLIDGWRTLLGTESLSREDLVLYAERRGGGLFALVSGGNDTALTPAGALWALWDLAGHTGDAAVSGAALDLARTYLDACAALPRSSAPKDLRLLHGLAAGDVRAGRSPTGGFEGRHYRALLWRGLFS